MIYFSFISGSMDRTAKLWHLEYTHPLRVFAGHEQDVDVVKFHPNCNYIATGGSDKTIRLWSHSDAKMVSLVCPHFTFLDPRYLVFISVVWQQYGQSQRNKSEKFVTNTSASKCTRICINWNPPFQTKITKIYLVKLLLNVSVVK